MPSSLPQTFSHHSHFEKHLQKSNADWFLNQKFAVNPGMPYLLKQWQDWPKNILLAEVAAYIQGEQARANLEKQPFALHKYLHHGLSSQAMLFNLVGPLIVNGGFAALQAAFEQAGCAWPLDASLQLEVTDRRIFHETAGQPTSIDLVIGNGALSQSLYIEAKLVEREFGGCSVFQNGDCEGRNPCSDFNQCYLHQIGRRYWTVLEKHGFLQGAMTAGPICPLANYYQFFREVLFALESGGDFVLLYDQRNPAFFRSSPAGMRGLMPFLRAFVPAEMQERVREITIQQILEAYRPFGFSWQGDFERKYGMI